MITTPPAPPEGEWFVGWWAVYRGKSKNPKPASAACKPSAWRRRRRRREGFGRGIGKHVLNRGELEGYGTRRHRAIVESACWLFTGANQSWSKLSMNESVGGVRAGGATWGERRSFFLQGND
jgi:hypothetical protein